jgi:regulator of sigma E protease
MLTIIIVIILFSLLVFVHELGHFVAARRNGVEVEEFGFGFPPRLVGVKRGKTIYSINWLPFGGFVRLKGEDGEASGEHTFAAANLWVKTKILLAGVGMNLLAAYVILLGLCLFGLPPIIEHQFRIGNPTYSVAPRVVVLGVGKASPAEKAGFGLGDGILSGNGQVFKSEDELVAFTHTHAGQTVEFVVEHSGKSSTKQVTLRETGASGGQLGIAPLMNYRERYGLWAPVEAAGLTGQLAWGTVTSFGSFIAGLFTTGKVSDSVAGPVGIVGILAQLVYFGYALVAVMIAQISVSLAVMNTLPIPALDGGRLAIAYIRRLSGGRITADQERWVHFGGFVILIGLMILVTVVDIRRL